MSVRDLLREQLEEFRDAAEGVPGLVYKGPADFVLQHGEWMGVHQLLPGMPRHCYHNAIGYAHDRGWEYVEGYALMPLPGGKFQIAGDPELAIAHAWVRDPATGVAYEVTWQAPGRAYLGVVFSAVRGDDATWNGDACVLHDWQRGFPLFRAPWTGETWHHTDDIEAQRRLALTGAATYMYTADGPVLTAKRLEAFERRASCT